MDRKTHDEKLRRLWKGAIPANYRFIDQNDKFAERYYTNPQFIEKQMTKKIVDAIREKVNNLSKEKG